MVDKPLTQAARRCGDVVVVEDGIAHCAKHGRPLYFDGRALRCDRSLDEITEAVGGVVGCLMGATWAVAVLPNPFTVPLAALVGAGVGFWAARWFGRRL